GLIRLASSQIGLRRFAEARRAIELTRQVEDALPHVLGNINIQLAKLQIGLGDVHRAAVILGGALPSGTTRVFIGEYTAYRGLALAASGELDAASRTLMALPELPPYSGTKALSEMGLAIVALARNGDDAARQAIDAVAGAESIGSIDAIVTASRAYPALVTA